jgi:hypothetical protein
VNTSTLKPGVLVSLKTTLSGGVNYQRTDIEQDHSDGNGGRVAKWETTRQIEDNAEYENAILARSAARTAITKVCHASSFGLLCPTEREPQLQAAIADARRIAQQFNATSARTNIGVYVLVGRVASDDIEAVRAIGAEVQSMITEMKLGIDLADPERIRESANKAKQIAGMLSDDIASKVSDAIKEARTAARLITSRVVKAGENAAKVVAACATTKLDAARFAVLDMEAGEVVPMEVTGNDLDFTGTADQVQS